MPHLVYVQMVGVAVVAVPVVRDQYQSIGGLLLLGNDSHESHCCFVDIGADECAVVVVLRPTVHAAVHVTQPLVPCHPECFARTTQFCSTTLEQGFGRGHIDGTFAVPSIGCSYQHHTVTFSGILGDGSSADETLVVGMGVQEENGCHRRAISLGLRSTLDEQRQRQPTHRSDPR